MGIIKVEEVDSVRFSAPDLERMKVFLRDFGMSEADDAGDGVLRMRGTGDAPFIHETVVGEPGFVSLALRAGSLADLEVLARAEGAQIVPAPGPGGGSQIVLRDPDGFVVEVVAGKARAARRGAPERAPWNAEARKDRPAEPKRLASGPSRVARLGHVVLGVTNLQASWDWWQSRFGLIMSDEVRAPNGDLAAAFIRFDRGAAPSDHHSLNFASIPGRPAGFHHAAFEVADFDDLMTGHEYLVKQGYHHDWGVGRHILGSQVFDYWKDPWGNRLEHWTDGDVFPADVPARVHGIDVMMGQQWGPDAPADFV